MTENKNLNHTFSSDVNMPLYFIRSCEFNAYLMQINVILSTVKKYHNCFTSDEYDFYFFTVANIGYFDNLGLTFSPKRCGMHRFCLT